MNLFKNLPTSDIKTFNTEGFEGEADYEDPVELLGTRNEEYGIDKYTNFLIKTEKYWPLQRTTDVIRYAD